VNRAEPTFEDEPVTARFDEKPSKIRFEDGRELSNVTFARVIQMIVTGELCETDEVDLMGQGFKKVVAIELLERHLPDAMTTASVRKPAPPTESADLSTTPFLEVLGRMYRGVESGLLLVEGASSAEEPTVRREIYLKNGTLFHVATGGPNDLLGQTLVRRNIITQEELDMALAVLSKYDGRLGDTLIGLALVDPVDLFRSIEEQGKERLLRVFGWPLGQLGFYRGVVPSRVEFPLELDLAELMLAGAEVSMPHDAPIVRYREKLGHKVRRAPRDASPRRRSPLPRPITLFIDTIGGGMELRHVLMRLSTTRQIGAPDALRALEVAIALGLVELD
jgi:serine/threonine-protein kinase